MTFFLLWNIKEDILKTAFVHTMKVKGVQYNTVVLGKKRERFLFFSFFFESFEV